MSEGPERDDLRLEEGDLCVIVMCSPVIVCTLMVRRQRGAEGQKMSPCALCCRE